MTHKTKEQKIKARFHQIQPRVKNQIGLQENPKYLVMDEVMHVKNDLKKTVFLTLAILCIEFVVFYATLRGINL